MDAAFIKAADFAGRFTCLGLPLAPLSLGHLFLLHDYSSAFVLGQPAQPADLILSVFICAQKQARARKNLKRWSTFLFLRFWGAFSGRFNLMLESGRFAAYLSHHLTVPDARSAVTMTRTLRAPAHWRLLTMLMVDFAMTEQQAMEYPMLKTNCLWATEAERNGSIELDGGRLSQFWNQCQQLDREKFPQTN
jgi:hypothetical protein